jgi:hypothetical protein
VRPVPGQQLEGARDEIATLCATAPGLLTDTERRDLLTEATAARDAAQRTDRPDWKVVDGHQFLGPARYWYSLEGRLRLALQFDLAARVSRRIDWPLVAVQSNYLYYEEGDFLGLHHDQARCPFTVIALLEGDAEPLCVHRELIGVPAAELGPLVEPDGHRGGEPVDLRDGPVVISGCVLPHHRMDHGGEGALTIATFCFAPAS